MFGAVMLTLLVAVPVISVIIAVVIYSLPSCQKQVDSLSKSAGFTPSSKKNMEYNAILTGAGGIRIIGISARRGTAQLESEQLRVKYIGYTVRSILNDVVIGKVIDQDIDSVIIEFHYDVVAGLYPYERLICSETPIPLENT